MAPSTTRCELAVPAPRGAFAHGRRGGAFSPSFRQIVDFLAELQADRRRPGKDGGAFSPSFRQIVDVSE